MLVDSHAHLDFVEDLESALVRAKEAGVKKIISVGTTLEESKRVVDLAEKNSADDFKIWTTAGIHPKDGKDEVERLGLLHCFKTLKQTIETSQNVVAVGECGLDYYLDDEKRIETVDKDKEFQRDLFEAQIKLAEELDLPLVVHCRNGWDEIFDLISTTTLSFERSEKFNSSRIRSNNNARGVFHSWTGDWTAAKKALDLGFYISFSGIVTFKNAKVVQEVAKKAPIERILVETDSPFLSPEPFRGQKNEPARVKMVCQFIADIRGETFDHVASNTAKNAQNLFNLL